MPEQYDVIVVGAGIVGGCILHQLAQHRLRVAVIDKENDAAEGTTKANSAIVHAGYDPKPGTKMAFHNVRGAELMKDLCTRYSVGYRGCGSLVIATSEDEEDMLQTLYNRGLENGVPGLELLSREETLRREPNLNPEVRGSLYAPSAGIVNPWELCIALVENAVLNGAHHYFNHEVTAIVKESGGYAVTTRPGKTFHTKILINAAGVHADEVHQLAAPADYSILPAKGQYYLLDKNQGGVVSHVVFQAPTKAGKGVLVAPTVHGNLIVGPDRTDCSGRTDLATAAANLEDIRKVSLKTTSKIDFRQSIRNFAGLRAISEKEDFIIREVPEAPGFIEVAGIQSPGLTAAPSIALEVLELIQKAGLKLERKESVIDKRTVVRMKELTPEEQDVKIKENPLYGRVICRCETITEGEIVDALKSPIAPPSLDAVKRRTAAGMGRCQGGFCSPRVLEIIMREKRVLPTGVLQDKEGSNLIFPREEMEGSK